jgi:hypothetical protein
MSSMNLQLTKSVSKQSSKSPSPNKKSDNKKKSSLSKIEVIDEVRESREGINNDNQPSDRSPRAEKEKSTASSPFKLKPRSVDKRSKTPQVARPMIRKRDDDELPAHIKKSPRWKKIESLN